MRDFPGPKIEKHVGAVEKRGGAAPVSAGKLAMTMVIMILVAIFFVQQRLDYDRTEKRVKRLLVERRKILIEIDPLRIEERYLTRLNKIEEIAKKKLNLREPGWRVRKIKVVKTRSDE